MSCPPTEQCLKSRVCSAHPPALLEFRVGPAVPVPQGVCSKPRRVLGLGRARASQLRETRGSYPENAPQLGSLTLTHAPMGETQFYEEEDRGNERPPWHLIGWANTPARRG